MFLGPFGAALGSKPAAPRVSLGPPPSPAVLAWSGLALWLLVAWGYWVDRHRTPRPRPAV